MNCVYHIYSSKINKHVAIFSLFSTEKTITVLVCSGGLRLCEGQGQKNKNNNSYRPRSSWGVQPTLRNAGLDHDSCATYTLMHL